MQVKIESSNPRSSQAAPGRAEEKPAKPSDDAPKAAARGARSGEVEVDVSALLQRSRQAIEARRAENDRASSVRPPALDVEAIAERIRSNPDLAAVAQGEVDPSRAYRLLSQLPGRSPAGRAALDIGDENRSASRIEPAQLESALRALADRWSGGKARADSEAARAAWVRSLLL